MRKIIEISSLDVGMQMALIERKLTDSMLLMLSLYV
jgi:hypothetical protein